MSPSDSRDRSRSPPRTKSREPKISKGFKWKEKSSSSKDTSDSRGDREAKKGKYRDREEADPYASRKRITEDRPEDERTKSKAVEQQKESDPKDVKVSEDAPPVDAFNTSSKFGTRAKFGNKASNSPAPASTPSATNGTSKPTTPATESKPKASKPAAPTGPMILVTVNDRLGTKAQIPCLASDPVRLFKAMVAAKIGRQPHEIMLKRQGERPFKDQLTLEDYGVSNGVQLDLELDTGD